MDLGKKIEKKLIILIVLFFVTGVLAHIQKEPNHLQSKASLKEVLSRIEGYRTVDFINLGQDIYDFLELDDYAYTVYAADGVVISLYVGYYFSGDKISSAHSPLVCFPGSGWEIDAPKIQRLAAGKDHITYAETIATLGTNRQLIIYWFQSYQSTTPRSWKKKLYALYNKFVNNEEQNAFVRISIPLEKITYDRALQAGTRFMQSFYPVFIKFVTGETDKS